MSKSITTDDILGKSLPVTPLIRDLRTYLSELEMLVKNFNRPVKFWERRIDMKDYLILIKESVQVRAKLIDAVQTKYPDEYKQNTSFNVDNKFITFFSNKT